MRNFKKILNKLTLNTSYGTINDPCCDANSYLKYYDFQNFYKTIQNLTNAEKTVKISEWLIRHLQKIIKSYCLCLQQPMTSQRSSLCKEQVKKFLEEGSIKLDPSLQGQNALIEYKFHRILDMVNDAFRTRAIDYILDNLGLIVNNDNNFINRFCTLTNNNPNMIRDITGELFSYLDEANISPEIEELLQLIPTVGGAEEAQIADCEVSAENDSVKGWATALAVSAATAAAAIALYRLTRGRSAKACTPDGKTKGVRILSRILCGAAAGGATQNAPSQETCDAVAEQIINDECSPNPSLCEPPSGGGGSQPPGGEVEPPSGGGGGVMGGDGLL